MITNTETQNTYGSIRPQSLVINDKKELYKSYMSFIQNGGIFMPFNEDVTPDKVSMGQKILIVFSMLDSKQKIPIQGKIVWISRNGINRGIGVAFGDTPHMKSLRESIEANIADLIIKKEPTYTI